MVGTEDMETRRARYLFENHNEFTAVNLTELIRNGLGLSYVLMFKEDFAAMLDDEPAQRQYLDPIEAELFA